MSDYIKLFDTVEDQFEFSISENYIQPHVSCTTDGNNLKYNKYNKKDLELLNMPFTIEVLEDGEVSWSLTNKSIYYSKNEEGWTVMTNETIIPVFKGDIVRFKGDNLNYSGNKFNSTAKFNAKGNIMSLINSNDFINTNTVKANGFSLLFNNCATLLSIKDLKLPATILEEYCYYSMFENCVNLKETILELPAIILSNCCYKRMFYGCADIIRTPKLPATILAKNCYEEMFYQCINLMYASELPALKLADSCYAYMFYDCTNLIDIPKILPATTLEPSCYYEMFYNCKSIIKAPVLPALELESQSYRYMFVGCISLNYVKALFITYSGNAYSWLSGVSASGTFVKNANSDWEETHRDIVPSGWTIITEEV